MEEEGAMLGVGFAIDFHDSFGQLRSLEAIMGDVQAKVFRDFQKMEQASKGAISLGAATAQVTAFGNAATRAGAVATREFVNAEKAADAQLRKLERLNDTIGKTPSELRQMKTEAAAARAELSGLTDIASRLRSTEAEIAGKELAAARRARFAAEELVETRAALAEQAVQQKLAETARAEQAVIVQLRERAQLENVIGRNTGVDRVRATDAGATFSALSARAAEEEAQAVRSASAAYQAFEARVRAGAAALREMEAVEKAAQRDAATAALKREAAAAKLAADQHERLAAIVRGSNAAMEADAVAAERIRAATDPLYAATKRLNAEIAESTRLYHAGATAPAEYARQQQVLTSRLGALDEAHVATAKSAKKSAGSLTQLSFQLNDVATMAALGAPPMQIFASQAGQIFQIAQMAEGGVAGFSKQIGGLALRFAPLAIAAGAFIIDLQHYQSELEKVSSSKAFADKLGLDAKEMAKLKDVTVTTGDVMHGVGKTISEGLDLGPTFKSIKDSITGYLTATDQNVLKSASYWYGIFVGSYRAISEIWNHFPAMIGDVFVRGVNYAIDAMNGLLKGAVDLLNGFAQRGNTILKGLGLKEVFGQLDAPQIKEMANQYAGEAGKAWKAVGGAIGGATKEADAFIDRTKKSIAANTILARNARLQKQADALNLGDKGPKAKTDRHAEQLAREAEAVEAQIKNLYALAEAYRVSDAAALIAEARAKAESAAIRKQGDVEEFVARQVRLAIAERVKAAAESAATLRFEADAQQEVNRQVLAGLIPAAQAADMLRDMIALRPLKAAADAAAMIGDVTRAKELKHATDDLTDAQIKSAAAKVLYAQIASNNAAGNTLDQQREELRLIGATDAARVHALATLRATQEAEANKFDEAWIAQQVAVADGAQAIAEKQAQYNEQLRVTADLVNSLGDSLSRAFGKGGAALGGMIKVLGEYGARQADIDDQVKRGQLSQAAGAKYSANLQLGSLIDITGAAKGLFKEHSTGYRAMMAAEKALAIVQLARTAIDVAGGAAKMFASLGPFAFPAVAAMLGVMASLGFGGGSHVSAKDYAKGNTGTGTVLGDGDAKSESIKRSIDQLKGIDDATLTVSRNMLSSLRSIEDNIGGLATLLVRTGNINASAGVQEGTKLGTVGKLSSNAVLAGAGFLLGGPVGALIGTVLSKIPVIGGVIKALFGTKTKVVGSGIIANSQNLGSILDNGFDASYYSDVQKKKKFFGITTSTKYKTLTTNADTDIERQFGLILKGFYDSIGAAAGPLGLATDAIDQKLQGFVVNIGKIDTMGLTGAEIQEKLEAAFGAAADKMAEAAVPGMEKFQKVGEGYYETLVRVASTVEQVDATFRILGRSSTSLGVDIDLAVSGMFDSVSDFVSASSAYFETYYSAGEQAAAKTAQMARAFDGLGMAMPSTLANFRSLVEAQDLATTAGRKTYATLLQLAPAFAELQTSMSGAKSAADILTEQQDLQRSLLEAMGDTAAIRALDLQKIDPSNRALQQQIWAVQDAKDAAAAAKQLSDAWTSIGDNIMDEVRRIRGLTDGSGDGSFASLLGQFNAATTAARGGDQDAAGKLVGLSQSLLKVAGDTATSRQELERVKAQTAASLEATYGLIGAITGSSSSASAASVLTTAATATTATGSTTAANDDLAAAVAALREELTQMRTDNNAGHAATTSAANRTAKVLEAVSGASGGDAISVANAA